MKAPYQHILLSLILISIGCLFLNYDEFNVIKQGSFIVQTYQDKDADGSSECKISRADSTICFDYTLTDAAKYPYAGINITAEKHFNLDLYDAIELNISSDKKRRIHVFYTLDTLKEKFLKFRYSLELNPDQQHYTIPIHDFNVPIWWLQSKNISETDIAEADLSTVKSISFSNDLFAEKNKNDSICLSEIKYINQNQSVYWFTSIGLILSNLFLFLLLRKRKLTHVIEYQASEVKEIDHQSILEKETQQIVNFISKNYNNSELNLRLIRKAVKIPENKISKLLKDKFGLSYKDYILEIRIEEAKRLLQSTQLNINEVAIATGFGSISTFNRVFKEQTSLTPTEFSKSTKN